MESLSNVRIKSYFSGGWGSCYMCKILHNLVHLPRISPQIDKSIPGVKTLGRIYFTRNAKCNLTKCSLSKDEKRK